MVQRLIYILCLVTLSHGSQAQYPEEKLIAEKALIDSLYSLEDYSRVVELYNTHFEHIKGGTWEDTLYSHCYAYARANWKSKGLEHGIEAARGICEEVRNKDKDAMHYIHAMSDLSWIYYEVGKIKECLVTDSLTMVFIDSRADVSDEIVARSRTYMAFDYAMLGNYRIALDYYLEGLAILESIVPRDENMTERLAEVANGIGATMFHLGRNDEAEAYYLKSLEYLGESEAPTSITRKASTVGNLGLMWDDLGMIEKSKRYYLENLKLNEQVIRLSDDPFLRDEATLGKSRTYGNIAALYFSLGDYGTSRAYLDLADRTRKSVLEPDDPRIFSIYFQYADIEIALGRLDKAIDLITQYLNACEKSYGLYSEYTSETLSNLAEVYMKKKEYQKADSLFKLSLTYHSKVSDTNTDPIIATTYLKKAECSMLAQKPEQALKEGLKSRDIFSNSFSENHIKAVNTDILIARALKSLNRNEEAKVRIEKAYKALIDEGGADSDKEESRQWPHVFPEVLHQRAQIKEMEGDLTGALEDLDLAIQSLNDNATGLMDEESKLGLFGTQKSIFDLYLDLEYERSETNESDQWKERMLQVSEENKSILLKNRLNEIAGLSFEGVPDTIIQREKELRNRLMSEHISSEDALEVYNNEGVYQEFLARLKRDYPDYFNLKHSAPSFSLRTIQDSLLSEQQSLLAYVRSEEFLYIFLVDKEKCHVERVDGMGINSAIEQLNTALMHLDMEAYLESSYQLYTLLFSPIRDRIKTKELHIIPDEQMYYLNYELLVDTESNYDDYIEHLLIQDYTISYLISAQTALQFEALKRKKEGKGVLALAPGFDDEIKKAYVTSVTDSLQLDRAYLRNVKQPFAVKTAEFLGSNYTASLLTRERATESSFKSQAESYNIIHLGTHTDVNTVSPLYSKLILSKESGGEDGYLHAYEIYEMELQAELAVLTACETGVGEQMSTEGVRSLAHSFSYAGCPSVVMSLWKIDEKSSSQIIEYFYENLSAGQAKNEALRNAKLTYLTHASLEESMPYYWAGLVLVGDESIVELEPAMSTWSILLLIILMLLGAIILYRWNQTRTG